MLADIITLIVEHPGTMAVMLGTAAFIGGIAIKLVRKS